MDGKLDFQFALFARYKSPVLHLTEISQEFLGISPKTAVERARDQALPIPAFKANKGKAPFLVALDDLAKHLEQKHEEALRLHQSIQA